MADTVTIRQKYDGLKSFLLPGVYNLTKDELILAKAACTDLIRYIPEVVLTYDLEDYRRTLFNQVKIIQRQLNEIDTPTFVSEIYYPEDSNLYQIALDNLDDALRWSELADLNGLKEPYLTEMTLVKIPVR